jgi:hypothetical protein
VVIGTVLGDALLAALCRLAEENASVRAVPYRGTYGLAVRGAGTFAGIGSI